MNESFGLPAVLGGDELNAPTNTAESRQETRQANVPELYKTTHERLACELAMRMDTPEEIFPRYGYDAEQAKALMESPAFTSMLERISADVRENGLAFKTKIKAVAEELIPHMFDMATDPLCSSAVRADIGKWAAKMAGFEPAPAKGEVAGGGGFNLSITFAGQAPQTVISGRETLIIDQEA